MCTSGDAAANAEGMGSIGARHLENREAQVRLFWGLLDTDTGSARYETRSEHKYHPTENLVEDLVCCVHVETKNKGRHVPTQKVSSVD